MDKKDNVITAVSTVIDKGDDFLKKAKDFISCVEILLDAATKLKAILDQDVVDEKPACKPLFEVEPKEEVKKLTFQEVRAVMATLSGIGKKDEAKALLTKYGANRLSEVSEDDYAALVADAEAIING